MDYDYAFIIVLVGYVVGKTVLIRRYVYGILEETTLATRGIDNVSITI